MRSAHVTIRSEHPLAAGGRPAVSRPAARPQRRRPRLQFSLLGLMVVMFALAVAAAPGYYMMRGSHELPQSRLVGMLMVLAGPLLVMTVLSIVVRLFRGGDPE